MWITESPAVLQLLLWLSSYLATTSTLAERLTIPHTTVLHSRGANPWPSHPVGEVAADDDRPTHKMPPTVPRDPHRFWRRLRSFGNIVRSTEGSLDVPSRRVAQVRQVVEPVPETFYYIMDILNAKVYDVVSETPLDRAPNLSKKIGNTVLLKREDLQPVFSFKIRGAYNKIRSLTAEQRAKGIIACSAGNHAQGVAYSAKKLGISAKIYMPEITPSIKVNAVRSYGSGVEVILVGSNFDEAFAACMECARREGRTLIHPFDDPLVIAGQGTIGMEVLKQTTSQPIDGIFICCGGGGLLSGVGAFIKAVAPHIKIYGVETADAAAMTESLKACRLVELDTVGTFADGAAVRRVGANTFKVCQEVVDEMITVSTDEVCAAIKDAFTDIRVVLEPAGALAIAGMKSFVERTGAKGKTFVAIASGANMDFDRLRFVSERADTSESLVSVIVPERPGTFRQLYDIIYPREVTEFSYRLCSQPEDVKGSGNGNGNGAAARAANQAHIMMSYRPKNRKDEQDVENKLRRAGFITMNLNSNELAKTHGRHLVGGRAPLAKDEVLYRVEFPEKPGALRKFLYSLSSKRNISLFHYRNHGSDIGRVLVGIQVPPEHRGEFQDTLHTLQAAGYQWIEETYNPVYRQFLSNRTAPPKGRRKTPTSARTTDA